MPNPTSAKVSTALARPLCSECFDATNAGWNFELECQTACSRCGRKCLGYIPTRLANNGTEVANG